MTSFLVNNTTREFIAGNDINSLLKDTFKNSLPIIASDIGIGRWLKSDHIIVPPNHIIPYIVCEYQALYLDKEAISLVNSYKQKYTTKIYT